MTLAQPIPHMLPALPHRHERCRLPIEARSEVKNAFHALSSIERVRQNVKHPGSGLQALFMGIAITQGPKESFEVAFAAHDGTYSTDFAVYSLQGPSARDFITSSRPSDTDPMIFGPSSTQGYHKVLTDFIVGKLCSYQKRHMYKYIGVGLTKQASEISPQLCSRLWLELDAVPFVFTPTFEALATGEQHCDMTVDEEANSMARKVTTCFGPNQKPHLVVGYRNEVGVDCAGQACITSAREYRDTVSKGIWNSMMKHADSLKRRNTKIAFFNSTPLGGDGASMKHALIRFLHLIQVDAKWYVPKPKPEVSHIIRNNYDILRGEAEPNVRLDQESICVLDEWCEQNAKQFWLSKDDPLAPRSRGGADVIIVGDLQMSSLVKIAKEQDPTRPVIFRCEIEICVYLADQKGTATSEVWSWIWDHVKSCDVFISHPVRDCVSKNVNPKKVGYMPATADWLDELNKDLPDWDLQFYIEKFRAECSETQAPRFEFPYRSYILQIVGSNHATETRDVLASYAELRHECMRNKDTKETPQLVILSYDTLTDLSATATYSQTLDLLRTQYVEIQRDVILVRSGPADQTFNALMSTARVVLQLSTRPGFEVIVSGALHKGVPVITTRVDGVSLQVEHGKSGFLVEDGNYKAVARYLHCLFTDHETYNNMAHYAATHVSDEVSTVGNALAWLYLADELSRGEKMEPKHRWINDMARKAAEFPYQKDERRLFRTTSFDATR